MKNRTSTCNSFGEKLNVGILKLRYGRTPFLSAPGCGCSRTSDPFAAPACCGEPEGCGDVCGDACGVGLAVARALICCCCAGVFSPLNDGSCRNLSNQAGSTRAPSLVRRGGSKSLPSGVE